MRLLTILIAIAALSTPAHAESTTAEPATPTVSSQLAHEQFLFEVTSHLYRWYMDEIDVVRGTRDKDTFVFWTRPLKVALDEGDKSLLGEVVLPVLSIAVRVKKADYTIEELDATIRNKRFKIINVARITVPDAMPAEYTKVEVERADMRAYLFKARNEARFPDDALLTRIPWRPGSNSGPMLRNKARHCRPANRSSTSPPSRPWPTKPGFSGKRDAYCYALRLILI